MDGDAVLGEVDESVGGGCVLGGDTVVSHLGDQVVCWGGVLVLAEGAWFESGNGILMVVSVLFLGGDAGAATSGLGG